MPPPSNVPLYMLSRASSLKLADYLLVDMVNPQGAHKTALAAMPLLLTLIRANLGAVATTNDYGSLSNPPTIPTDTAQLTNGAGFAKLDSPALTGVPTAPTPPGGDASTKLATTAFVETRVQALIGMAPAALDTLQELAAQMQNDESAVSTLTAATAGKLSKSANLSDLGDAAAARGNLGLGSVATHAASDFASAAQGAKADSALQTQAQADWNATSAPTAILNKPVLGSAASQPVSAFATAAQGVKADGAAQASALAAVATSGSYADLSNRPVLATVAATGVYSDLTGKPALFSGAYADLTGKPNLGTAAAAGVSDFATPAQVTAAINNLVNGAPSALDTLKEIADRLVSDESAVSALTATVAGKFATPTGTTAQYLRGDGSLATFPTIPAPSTVTVNAPLTNGGSSTAASLSISAASTSASGSMSAADKAKLDAFPAYVARAFNNAPARALVSAAAAANGFQVSATRDALASYGVTITATATGLVAGASSGYVALEICQSNSALAADWKEVDRLTNGQTFTSVLTLQSSQPVGASLRAVVPAGWYARLRTVNVAGTPSYALGGGQEVLL